MMAAAGQTTPAMPVPYSDFPDLRTHITFDSVKHKIEVGVAVFLLLLLLFWWCFLFVCFSFFLFYGLWVWC